MTWKPPIAIARPTGSWSPVSRLLDRIRQRVHGFHLFVLKMPITSASVGTRPAPARGDIHSGIEFRKITDANDPDLDALVGLDGMQPAFADEALRQGNHCYVACLEGEVIAATWSTQNTTCRIKELNRELGMPPDETYGWGTYCAPPYRGLNVVPELVDHANAELARHHGKTACIGIVVTSNSRMLRAMGKLGGRKVGRIGYLQVGTFRLHYLLGSGAFRGTARRIYVERVWT